MLQDIPDNWQHADIDKAVEFCTRFNMAVDCGAHRGVVTRRLAQYFKRVVAIEPSDLADLIDCATVIKAALGEVAGQCGMRDGKYNTGQRHVVEGDDVEVITLDSMNIEPDFIKIDVEGREWHVLKGGEDTIRRCQPVIMLEENGLNRRYGVPDGEPGRLLESWGARRVLVLKNGHDEDWVYQWPKSSAF